MDHTRTANPCDWLPRRRASLLLVCCPHSIVYLHLSVVEGLIFCISATPHLGTSFPLFHGWCSVNYICWWFPWGEIYDTADTLMTRESTLVSQTPSSHYREFDHNVPPTWRRFVSHIWQCWKIFVINMEQFLSPLININFQLNMWKVFSNPCLDSNFKWKTM